MVQVTLSVAVKSARIKFTFATVKKKIIETTVKLNAKHIVNTCTNAVSGWPLQNLSMPNLFRQACGIDAVNNS